MQGEPTPVPLFQSDHNSAPQLQIKVSQIWTQIWCPSTNIVDNAYWPGHNNNSSLPKHKPTQQWGGSVWKHLYLSSRRGCASCISIIATLQSIHVFLLCKCIFQINANFWHNKFQSTQKVVPRYKIEKKRKNHAAVPRMIYTPLIRDSIAPTKWRRCCHTYHCGRPCSKPCIINKHTATHTDWYDHLNSTFSPLVLSDSEGRMK